MLQEKVVRGKFFGRLKKNISQGNSSWLGVTNPNSKSKYSARMLQEGGALKKNWEMYLTSPTAFAGIEAIVFSVLSAGFEIEHESEEIKKRYTRRFDKIYPKLYSVLTNALVFGDSYTKIIEGKDNFVTDLELFFPPDVTIKDDKYYVKEKGKIVPLKNIWQFQLMPRSDKSYGISLLGIAREPLEWKTEIDEAVTEAIKRHGFSKYHIICSKDDRGLYPDDNRLRELERQFRKIHVGHEFVSTDKINIKPIDTSGFPALLDYLQYFTNLAATGLMVPAEVLGQGASAATFATAKVRMEHFQKRVIPYFQQVLECSINEYLLGENAEGALFHFKEPVPLSMKTEEY